MGIGKELHMSKQDLVVLSTEDAGAVFVQKATCGEFTIESIKSKKAPEHSEFLPAKVLKDGQVLWSFKGNHPGYHGLARLVGFGDEFVIVLCTKVTLHDVVPIADLPDIKWMPDSGRLGGRKLRETVVLKEAIANKLGLQPAWSVREDQMLVAVHRQQAEAQRLARAEQVRLEAEAQRLANEQREAARKERELKRREITSRKRLHVFTASGDRRSGIPVVTDEWKILPADVFCVQVESYNAETGAYGGAVESFVTKKNRGGETRKDKVVVVFDRDPREAKKLTATLVTKVMEIKGELEEVVVVPDMDTVRTLNASGLNSGTLVLVDNGTTEFMDVLKLDDGKISTLTQMRRIHMAQA
jgi:hypothetical protein